MKERLAVVQAGVRLASREQTQHLSSGIMAGLPARPFMLCSMRTFSLSGISRFPERPKVHALIAAPEITFDL